MWEFYPFSVAMTLVMVFYLFYLGARVGKARGTYNVDAPSCDGPVEFNRLYRIHQNTQEQFIMFLPVFALFSMTMGDQKAAIAAVVWLIGRFVYDRAYRDGTKSRAPGMLITIGATAVCFFGVIIKAAITYATML